MPSTAAAEDPAARRLQVGLASPPASTLGHVWGWLLLVFAMLTGELLGYTFESYVRWSYLGIVEQSSHVAKAALHASEMQFAYEQLRQLSHAKDTFVACAAEHQAWGPSSVERLSD